MKPLINLSLAILCLAFFACKQGVVYDVQEEAISPIDAQKGKLKSEGQYISILHANLFQKALSANELVEIENIIFGFGDKDLIHEVLISNFMNNNDVKLATDSFMHANTDQFLLDTYERFLVRTPSEAEKTWFKNYIETHPNVTPELIYFAFALSNEYLYY